MSKDSLRNLRKIEYTINKHLFLICGLVTLVTMIMVLIEFFTCGFFSAVRIEFFYLGVLVIYSLHKELVRWLGEEKVERQGEYFVYTWIGLTTLLYIINFFVRGRFPYISNCDISGVLKDASLVTLEVLTVFILTRFLKLLRIFIKIP